MGAKQPRGVEVAFSTAQLDDAGINDSLDDSALSDIVDDFFLSYADEFRESVRQWLDEHQDEEDEVYVDPDLEGQPEFNGSFR